MRCPNCDNINNHVVNTYHRSKTNDVKRRRECLDCQTRFNSIERISNKDEAFAIAELTIKKILSDQKEGIKNGSNRTHDNCR